jgi:hypothetical protein
MRAILAVAIIAAFVLVLGPWSINSTVANARLNVATSSIDPPVTTLDAAGMPTYVGL